MVVFPTQAACGIGKIDNRIMRFMCRLLKAKKQPTKMGCPGYFRLMGNSTFNVNWFSWVVISAVPPYFSAVS